MSKLLEHKDRDAKKLNLEAINSCIGTIRSLIPSGEDSEKSKLLKQQLAIHSKKLVDSMLGEQGLVVKLVPVIEAECGNNPENHGYFWGFEVFFLKKKF